MSDQKCISWAQLKEFCNSLSDEQLQKPVQWWGEEVSGYVFKVHQLEEDFVTTDYGCEPASVQEYEEGDDPYEVTHPAGTPMLEVD